MPGNIRRNNGAFSTTSKRLPSIVRLHTKIAHLSLCKLIPAIKLGRKIRAVKLEIRKLSCDPASVVRTNIPITMISTASTTGSWRMRRSSGAAVSVGTLRPSTPDLVFLVRVDVKALI
jgi:hypothetical protein